LTHQKSDPRAEANAFADLLLMGVDNGCSFAIIYLHLWSRCGNL